MARFKTAVFGPCVSGQYKGHKLVVQTAQSACHPFAKRKGYCIRLDPPYKYELKGEDIEGIGWWPYNPPKQMQQQFCGWYKYKARALLRARELSK